MTELHIHISPELPIQTAIHYAALSGITTAGLVFQDLSFSQKDIKNHTQLARELALIEGINVFIGFELKHVPPALIPAYTEKFRGYEFDYITVYGETLADAAAQGTNLAAINAKVDILTHAGIIDKALAEYAKEESVAFEISVNPMHSAANALVAFHACQYDIPLIWGANINKKEDFAWLAKRIQFAQAAQINQLPFNTTENGLIKKLNKDTSEFVEKLSRKLQHINS